MNSVFQRLADELQSMPEASQPASLYDPVRYTLQLGGKYIRPRFVLLGAAMSGKDPEMALPAAKAVELLHVFTLIHDDIMDNAQTRRGKETVAVKWGSNQAILSGDVLFGMAIEELSKISDLEHLDKKDFANILQCFLRAVRIICEGQAKDMEFENRTDVSLEEYLDMIGAKTAALLAASVEMGVRIGGFPDAMAKAAYEFGWNTGVAFQIQDDVLDAIGNSDKTGKVVGGDIREGKKTYLTLLAIKSENQVISDELKKIFAKEVRTDDDVMRVISCYHETGTISKTEAAIRHHYELAMQNLEKFPDNEPRNEIKRLLEQLMQREK